MRNWQMGIDFGTSFTVVAVAKDGGVEVVDVESDGRSRLPSAVFLTEDGDVLVGSRALHQAVFAPDRFEPTPKRAIGLGELFLGDGLVEVSDLVAGVFRRVYTETCRQQGGTAPSAVRVTHPADWAEARLNVLRRAVAAAGVENAVLVAEPVAAAARIAMSATQPGQVIAVYDFGGGTFDAAVLRRTEEGFEVAGPPTGRDPLGGEDIDRRIFEHIGGLLADEYPDEWKNLTVPGDVAWRRHAASLREEIRQAKETLSEVAACQLWISGIDRGVQLTRSELEELIRNDIDDTVDTLADAITAAGTTPEDLGGIYLVGGSSRIPLVADTIWRRLGVVPTSQENPKSVVAMGAAAWMGAGPGGEHGPAGGRDGRQTAAGAQIAGAQIAGAQIAGTQAEPSSPGRTFSTRLAMGLPAGVAGVHRAASLVIQPAGSGRVNVYVWAAPPAATSEALAYRLGEQYRISQPGYREVALQPASAFGDPAGIERRYIADGAEGTRERIDRYLVAGAYSFAATAPSHLAAHLDMLAVMPPPLDPAIYFGPGLTAVLPAGTSVYERVQLTVGGTLQQVTATRAWANDLPVDQWLDRQVSRTVASRPGTTEILRTEGPIIADLPGRLVILRVPGTIPLVQGIGVCESDGDIYEVAVWVPESDRHLLPGLAQQVTTGANRSS